MTAAPTRLPLVEFDPRARGELEESLATLRELVTQMACLLQRHGAAAMQPPAAQQVVRGGLIVQHFHGPVNNVAGRDSLHG